MYSMCISNQHKPVQKVSRLFFFLRWIRIYHTYLWTLYTRVCTCVCGVYICLLFVICCMYICLLLIPLSLTHIHTCVHAHACDSTIWGMKRIIKTPHLGTLICGLLVHVYGHVCMLVILRTYNTHTHAHVTEYVRSGGWWSYSLIYLKNSLIPDQISLTNTVITTPYLLYDT